MEITDIGQLDLTKRYSYADYLTWKIQERLELIKGFVYKMSPAPNVKHQTASFNLSLKFGNFFKTQDCRVFSAPFDVKLSDSQKTKDVYTVVQPDICVICDPTKLDEHGCVGSPDLVIEILSPGNTNREMGVKFDLYEENGIQEYWLVEPNDKIVLIYTLQNGKYIGLKPFTDEGNVTSVMFPDLSFAVSEIFE